MAVAQFQFYTSTASVREDLLPEITNISPKDTPFTSRIGKTQATSRNHEWLTDALEARTAQAVSVEGVAFASATRAARSRLINYTEILLKAWTVSGSVQAMDTVSQGKTEFRYQRDLRRQELANGIEYRCVAITATAAVSGASGTASQLKGLLPWITTNASTSAAQRSVSLTIMNGALQSCWSAGGDPGVIMCGGARKLNLLNLISSSYGTRNMSGAGGVVDQRFDLFYSEFGGQQEVVLSRDIDVNSYAILEMMRWKLAYLRRPHIQSMGVEGDRMSAQWCAEYTLEARSESANAKVQQISA